MRKLMAFALAATMLVAQLAGLQHRIEHAGGAPLDHAPVFAVHDHGEGAPVDDHTDAGRSTHDCGAYDAATLGDGPPLGSDACRTTLRLPEAARIAHLAQPGSAPQLGFQSRAPPRA
jgi:hypothetical protein